MELIIAKGGAMNGDIEKDERENSADEQDNVTSEDVPAVDNVGDMSVEINVEELVAKLEANDGEVEEHKQEIHRRLEALNDEREADQSLDSTYDFNLNDEL